MAIAVWPSVETLPFHVIAGSVSIAYGFRVGRLRPTATAFAIVATTTSVLVIHDALAGEEFWEELLEGPLLAGLFIAMVWYAERRQRALEGMGRLAAERAQLLDHQERLLHDVAHELRTPVTIARGHLETMPHEDGAPAPEIAVAIDELDRIARIVERLLLLAKAEQPNFVECSEIDVEPFLEEVFLRWSEVAPRVWRLGDVVAGTLRGDPHRLRIALDALLENAVEHTTSADPIVMSARGIGDTVAIAVGDGGPGVPADEQDRIFKRFGRADASRSRRDGGVGLGLPIADAIARAHGGSCKLETSPAGSTFSLHLAGFVASPPGVLPGPIAGRAARAGARA